MRSPAAGGGYGLNPQCMFVEQIQQNNLGGSNYSCPDCLDGSTRMMLDHLSRVCASTGLKVSNEELMELGIFAMFISSRVKSKAGISISCMSLWTEWVRFFLKTMNSFPNLICEEEFRDLVVSRFGCDISQDENGGPVYPGIEFIPERNVTIPVTDSTFARA